MKERELSMHRDITNEEEQRMQQLMEIPCVHSVTWHDANNIDIVYVQEPNEEEEYEIKQLTK